MARAVGADATVVLRSPWADVRSTIGPNGDRSALLAYRSAAYGGRGADPEVSERWDDLG